MPAISHHARHAIALKNVTKTFEGRALFEGLNMTVPWGEVMVLMGQSGLGKTTLLRMMAGQTAFEGEILVDGGPVSVDHTGRAHAKIAYVTQQPNLWTHLSALDNVALPRRYLLGETRREARHRAMTFLDLLDLGAVARQLPHRLSGGEQQRVSLARGLAAEKPILLLDEVTSNIDPARREAVARHLRRLATEGRAIVFVTHDLATARLLAPAAHRMTPQGPVAVAWEDAERGGTDAGE